MTTIRWLGNIVDKSPNFMKSMCACTDYIRNVSLKLFFVFVDENFSIKLLFKIRILFTCRLHVYDDDNAQYGKFRRYFRNCCDMSIVQWLF